MGHDRFRQRGPEAGHARQQRGGGGVEVDADRVHGVFHHRIQRTGKPILIDVMLVLPDADGLRFDLDQLGQRILQPARDRHGAAQRYVEIRELGRGRLRSRIDRRTGLAHDHLDRLRRRHVGQHLGDQLLRFAAAGAVADCDQLDAVPADEAGKLGLRAPHVVLRREGIDGGRRHELAGAVDHGDLDARPDAGIEPHRGARAGRRGQQQVLQIAGKDVDRLLLGPLAQVAHQVEGKVQRKLHPPRPADDLHQPSVARKFPADRIGLRDHAFDRLHRRSVVGIHLDIERQHVLVAAAQHGERPVARHAGPALDMVEIVGEFRAGLLLAVHDARAQEGPLLHVGCAGGRRDRRSRRTARTGCPARPRAPPWRPARRR